MESYKWSWSFEKKERSDQTSKRKIVETLKDQSYSKTGKSYPMQLILKVARYSSSTWYEKPTGTKGNKPGPRPAIDETQALELIKEDLKNSKFNGEGYLKVKKRLAKAGKHIAKHRVNTLMREHELLSPHRPVKNGRKRTHEGRIITDRPDKMWATDGKKFWAGKDGWCWFFGVIDHFNDEIIAWHVAKQGTDSRLWHLYKGLLGFALGHWIKMSVQAHACSFDQTMAHSTKAGIS